MCPSFLHTTPTFSLQSCPRKVFFQGFFDVSINISWMVCRMFLIFYERNKLRSGHLLDTFNIRFGRVKKFLEAFEKKFQLKICGFVRIFQPHFELHFVKVSTFFTFPDIESDWYVVWSQFFHWRKYIGQANFFDTSNIPVKST